MRELNVKLDRDSSVGLQVQVRRWLIDAIARGILRPGRRLPSSRYLAKRAGVSRNTVALAYAALLAEGHLVSRARSGVFVAEGVSCRRLAVRVKRAPGPLPPAAGHRHDPQEHWRLPNWHRYPYPFVDGYVDPKLLPTAEWREATRMAFGRHEVGHWSIVPDGADDPFLLEELRTKVLPTRGITASADEILVALTARQALHLIAELLVQRGTPVYCQESDASLLHRIRERQAQLLPADALSRPLPEGTVLFSCPVRAFPSGTPAQPVHALDDTGVLVEHDVPPDLLDEPARFPSRSCEPGGSVISVMSLSAVASAGLPLALIVADPSVIRRLRHLRHHLGLLVPIAQQRAWGHFVGLGHYAAVLARTSKILQERRMELRDALNYYMRKSVVIEAAPGTSAYWVRGANGLDAREFVAKAAARGILIEPGPAALGNVFRVGVTGIETARVRPGVKLLASLLRREPAQMPRSLSEDTIAPLSSAELHRRMTGAVLLYTTVYGDPCTIEVHADGTLIGRAGHHDEDCDRGRWWIEGDRWYRQWYNWVYGELSGFRIVVEGEQMRWYGSDGLLADTAVIADGPAQASGAIAA
jgi:GntR family transcriptional regulator/MocR family aminotransferase